MAWIGIGGWSYPSWRGTFYPAEVARKDELTYASRRLTSIEINATYYRSQSPASFVRWHDETPDGFVFAVKGPRFVTNRRVLAEAGPAIERFLAGGVMALGDKLGPINWQMMPTKVFEPDDFAAFLALLPPSADGRPLRHAVEVRHDSFRCAGFVSLMREHGVAVVVAGDSRYPQIADPTAAFVYARIMGVSDSEPAGYSEPLLDQWSQRIQAWEAGEQPEGLRTVAPPVADGIRRNVFLYVISGCKERNPAAAMALMQRLRG
jgi:uncharacterized protein YecE (DUF72 family)